MVVFGLMHGESATAPTFPPPGPGAGPPGSGVLKPGCSLQQALESVVPSRGSPSASSNVTSSRPLSLKAGEFVIRGTQSWRNEFAWVIPPGPPSAHGVSWPSLQRSGVMKE